MAATGRMVPQMIPIVFAHGDGEAESFCVLLEGLKEDLDLKEELEFALPFLHLTFVLTV